MSESTTDSRQTTIPIEQWLDESDEIAAVTVDEREVVYILPHGSEGDDQTWVCVNTHNNAVWTSDTRMVRVMFRGCMVHPLKVD